MAGTDQTRDTLPWGQLLTLLSLCLQEQQQAFISHRSPTGKACFYGHCPLTAGKELPLQESELCSPGTSEKRLLLLSSIALQTCTQQHCVGQGGVRKQKETMKGAQENLKMFFLCTQEPKNRNNVLVFSLPIGTHWIKCFINNHPLHLARKWIKCCYLHVSA